ncbi:hypothetical protein PTKIN_Ptkin19aG0102000 [Pterospermum kingtungense]
MMKGLVVDEISMSNLTSTSGEVSASSATRIETGTGTQYYPQQSFVSSNQTKKKRNLPGNPDPDAEVIALSPKTLLATNRFVCEICNKGFRRDQNLQLHRRGHNLPWKLKQRTNKEVVIKKKVYVCPETTCVHHDPSRALGDLTGIKKHFSRKHGEKKWKCEKCSKRYAVQSDWKAHSKICGTKEYRCDCGSLFSRRDSFITHRAFCDALAEESARAITAPNYPVSHMINLQSQLHGHALHAQSVKPSDHSIAPWLARPSSALLLDHHQQAQDENPSGQNPSSNALPPYQALTASPHMSATALLQKAAQMGVTISKPLQPPHHHHHHHHQAHMSGTTGLIGSTSTAGSSLGLSAREELGSGFPHGLASFGNKAAVTSGFMEQSVAAATNSTTEYLNGIWNTKGNSSIEFEATTDYHLSKATESQLSRSVHEHEGRGSSSSASSNINGGNNDGLTRDFLGLKAFPHNDFPNLAGFNHNMNPSSAYRRLNQKHQKPWQS